MFAFNFRALGGLTCQVSALSYQNYQISNFLSNCSRSRIEPKPKHRLKGQFWWPRDFPGKMPLLSSPASNGATIVPNYTGTSMTLNFAKKCSIFDFLGSKRIYRTRASDLAPFHKPPLLASLATLEIAFT